MKALRWSFVIVPVLFGRAVAPAAAQAAPKPVTFTGDIGFVSTAGNTSVTTLNLGDKLTYKPGKALLTQTLAFVYGKSDGEEQANNQALRLRADYPLSARLSAYALAGYERNRFAGIARRFDEGVGLGYAVWHHPMNELDLEAGLGIVQESRFLAGTAGATGANNHGAGRAAARFKHLFTKATYFLQTVEYLADFKTSQDYRINTESALVAPISSHIGLKAGYLIKYNHLPPSPDLRKTDRLFTTGVQISY